MANLSNINNKFIVVDDGNVLIGATSTYPQGDNTILKLYSPSIPRFYLQNTTTGSNVTDGSQFYVSSSDLYITNSESANIILSTAGTTRLTIDSSGNLLLGAGTGNPYLALVSAGGNGGNQRARIFGYADGGTYGGGLQIQTRNDVNVFGTAVTIDHDKNVGIGTTSPIGKLSVSDAGGTGLEITPQDAIARISLVAYDRIDSAYRELNFDGYNYSFRTSGNVKAVMLNSGNVGIGTTNPYAPLHVSHSLANGGLMLGNTATTGSREMLLNIHPLGLIWQRWVNGAYQSNLMTLDYDGNLGIGTTSPIGKFNVSKDSTTDGSSQAITISSSSANTKRMNLGYVPGSNYSFIDTIDYGISNTNQALSLQPNGGNVGIGTTSPTLKLDVASTYFGLPATSGTTPVGFQRWGYTDRTWGGNEILMGIINAGDYPGFIQCKVPTDYSGTRPFLINPQGGNVGIGTTSPSAPLTVHGQQKWYTTNGDGNELRGFFNPGGSGDPAELSLYQADASTVGVELRATGDSYFTGGRVGIGNTNPQAALDITSNYSIQGGVYTYYATGGATGQSNLNFDITVNNEGGGGNVFKIEAGFAHYNGMTYNSIGEWWCTSRGTAVVNTYILNAGTTLGGTWSASKPTTSVLRITKSAGTYPGGGKYWVKVTYRPY